MCSSDLSIYNEQGAFKRAAEVLEDGLTELPDDPELHYRIAGNLMLDGQMREGFNYLETALSIDPEGYSVLLEYFPRTENQRMILRVIEQFRNTGRGQAGN